MADPSQVTLLESLLAGVGAIHREVDAVAQAVLARQPQALRCGPGCADCCPADLTVLDLEAEWIRLRVGDALRGEVPSASGCAFLDEARRCRIYPHRPYVCRTHGLPLVFFEEDEQGEIIESRDVCEKNRGAAELGALDRAELWLIGPYEARLVELAEARPGDSPRRRDLAGLFQELAAAAG
jgi:uncharacterized protein